MKAILFDWGGVIAPENNIVAANLLSEKYKVDKKELLKELLEKEHDYMATKEDKEFFELVGKKFNIPAKEIEDTLNSVLPIRKSLEVVKETKEGGFKVFLVSNQNVSRARILQQTDFLNDFDKVFFSCDIGLMKPDEKYYKHVLESIGIDPSECLFIDDKKENIEGASLLGINTLHLLEIDKLEEELVNRLQN